MATKNVFEIFGDSSAENALVRCDKLDRDIARNVADLEIAQAAAEKQKAKLKELQKRRDEWAAALEEYFITRRDSDFTGEGNSRRQKSFKGGTVGFRKAPPTLVRLGKYTWEKIVEKIKGLLKTDPDWKKVHKDDVIKTSETVRKDEIKSLGLPAAALERAGIAIEEPDLFWLETDFERDMKISKGEKVA